MEQFDHQALNLTKDKPLVYTAMSKQLFYFRMFVSAFVLKAGAVPLNPFMMFDYFLHDAVNRDLVRTANNNLVVRADEVWVFGNVSDGVLAEIQIARNNNKTVRYFVIQQPQQILEVAKEQVVMEDDVRQFVNML